jgi:hypothetical protein
MSAQEAAALITAFALLLGALGGILAQLRQTHGLVNSRMTELVELTKRASLAEGRLAQKADDSAQDGSGLDRQR